MNALGFSRHVLGIGLAVTMLAGCGGSQGQGTVATGVMPQGAAGQPAAHRGPGSWMLPEAKRETLIYAATGTAVLVYSYPNGKHVGTIKQPYAHYNFLCSDSDGNVYMPVVVGPYGHYGYYIEKYPHAKTAPSVTLVDPVASPIACSVDPTTQNLAVNEQYNFIVFPGGQPPPTEYQNNYISGITNIAYDDSGNLFLHGSFESYYRIFELPNGSSKIVGISVGSEWFPYVGSLQWDGQDLAVGNVLEKCWDRHCRRVYGQSVIYRIAISGTGGTIVQTENLGHQKRPNDNFPFWLYDQTIIQASDKKNETHLGIWNYPSGGRINNVPVRNPFGAYGVTVSVAPSGSPIRK